MSIQRHIRYATTLVMLGWAIVGCSSATIQKQEQESVFPEKKAIVFPDMKNAWQTQGSYPNLANLRTLREGMSKDQVYDLLGRPHFDEGMFGEHEWNFIFHMPDHLGRYRTCQYQLHFDDDMLVDGRYWKEGECARSLAEEASEDTRVSVSADALFDFDSDALSPQGEREIDELASWVLQGMADGSSVIVIGHADRLGDEAYNQVLSERRAVTVRRALIKRGIREGRISSWGEGDRRPVQQCSEIASIAAQRACLAPNRRVDIQITGHRARRSHTPLTIQ